MKQNESVQTALLAMGETAYKDFQSKLIPNIDPATVIGIRIPKLRAYAKTIAGTPMAAQFLRELPHQYYEENNLHAFLIEQIRDYSAAIKLVDAFLPYIDNWATCDSLRPKSFKQHRFELLEQIKIWIKSDHPYTVRFAIEMLMVHFLDDEFDATYLEIAANVQCEDYYVRMMVAWYFATALAKQYSSALEYLQKRKLPRWTHNRTIQKAVESDRITQEQKDELRSLRY